MLSLTLLCLPVCSLPQAPPIDPTEIRVVDLQAHIGFLASDELEGRESGEQGGHLAANYFAKQWQRLGLLPLGGDGQGTHEIEDYLLPFETRGYDCFNTAGYLPGTDPELANSYMVIGGHHDHAGVGGPGAMGFPGEIHNGADDNASGSSGVAELAEWYVEHPLRRPIVFMTFSAEERGLLGSRAFVKQEIIPTEEMFAMINCDMIGRSVDGYLYIGGLGTADEFHPLLDQLFEECELNLELGDAGEAPSDNTSFYNAGVPALFFFTNIHEDYHMPGDDIEKINFRGEVEILELIRDVTDILDTHNDALSFHKSPGMAMPADFNQKMMEHYVGISKRNSMRGKLGVSIESAEGGLKVTRVRENSAADGAGLQTGDLITNVNSREVNSSADLRRAMGGLLRGEEISLSYSREGEGSSVTIELG